MWVGVEIRLLGWGKIKGKTELKVKGFECGHHCQGSGHSVGQNVPRIRNVPKIE